MAHIGQIRSLRELDLSDTAVGDAGMAHLRPLAGLESLNLSYSAVGDDGLRALRALPSLRNLNLDSRLVGPRLTASAPATTRLPCLPEQKDRLQRCGCSTSATLSLFSPR